MRQIPLLTGNFAQKNKKKSYRKNLHGIKKKLTFVPIL